MDFRTTSRALPRAALFVLTLGTIGLALSSGTASPAFAATSDHMRPAGVKLAAAPETSLYSTSLGNVFLVGEQVSIGVTTLASQVKYRITDAYGTTVEEGIVDTVDSGGVIDASISTPGWYAFSAWAIANDGSQGLESQTTIAVLEPSNIPASGDSPFGVVTHFGQNWSPSMVPLIELAGISTARDELYWSDVELTKGSYALTDKQQTYLDALDSGATSPLVVLSYANALYGGNAPDTPEARDAFAAYASYIAGVRGDQTSVYEVWNEWNIGLGAPTADMSADAYLELLKVVYPAIKSVAPNAVVAGPVLSGASGPWLDRFMSLGGLEYIDALSIHPYNYPGKPEGLDSELANIENRMATLGQPRPIIISEQGWPTGTDPRAISDSQQASYLTRAQVIALSHDVSKYVIYDFMDDGTNPADTENRFGLVHNVNDPLGAYTPKPSYVAESTLTRMLSGTTYLSNSSSQGTFDYLFQGESSDVRVLWSNAPRNVQIPASGPVTVTKLYGERSELVPDDTGMVQIAVGPDPLFITGTTAPHSDSSIFDLSVKTAVLGEPVVLEWSATNQGVSPLTFSLLIEGQTVTVTVPGGETVVTPITLQAPSHAGLNSYSGTVSVGTVAVAHLSADADILSATPTPSPTATPRPTEPGAPLPTAVPREPGTLADTGADWPTEVIAAGVLLVICGELILVLRARNRRRREHN